MASFSTAKLFSIGMCKRRKCQLSLSERNLFQGRVRCCEIGGGRAKENRQLSTTMLTMALKISMAYVISCCRIFLALLHGYFLTFHRIYIFSREDEADNHAYHYEAAEHDANIICAAVVPLVASSR